MKQLAQLFVPAIGRVPQSEATAARAAVITRRGHSSSPPTPARASATESGHPDIAPAAELPA